ncbi:MAG TPA: cytochrome P450 [Solirubrobacteraceae bacterium]|nr:cytochrome P450 [Solirubrobacteraceae bacterium]
MSFGSVDAEQSFPLGAAVTLAQLDQDPHPVLAALRSSEPVSWLPALNGWLVTRYDLVTQVMRDSTTFTVDDPRFSTAQVVGPSMLSLDGEAHARHREPFAPPFRPRAVRERFAEATAAEADRLIDRFEQNGTAELRRAFAGPLAASIMARALGLEQDEVATMLGWYDAIVAAVTDVTAGRDVPSSGQEAFDALRDRLQSVIAQGPEDSLLGAAAAQQDLTTEQIVSNAAVLLFGGIETTEGMIANALLDLLEHPELLAWIGHDRSRLDAALEESLRLEPAAAVVDRYATTDTELRDAQIRRGELVRVSISAANRDPAVFPDPNRFDPGRVDRAATPRRHLTFAHGPHVCLGVHLARLEGRTGLETIFQRLPDMRSDPRRPSRVQGLVFRKPASLHVLWGDR